MHSKWYISILFILFAYLGTVQEPASVPNQEIVLEFTDAQVGEADIQNTITDVREKLLNIGATNIIIQETNNHTLKISYYSTADAENIKEVLLEENKLVVDQNYEKKEDSDGSLDYKIDIYELTDDSDFSERNNDLVFENKYSTDRFILSKNYKLAKSVPTSKANQLFQTAYNNYKKNPFSKDCTSHKEPEVRAGPQYTFTS